MKTKSALSKFKLALTPGTKFEATFEASIIKGNCGDTIIPSKTESRVVVRTTKSRVYFLKPDGKQTSFDFPTEKDFSEKDNTFIWSIEGKQILSYKQS